MKLCCFAFFAWSLIVFQGCLPSKIVLPPPVMEQPPKVETPPPPVSRQVKKSHTQSGIGKASVASLKEAIRLSSNFAFRPQGLKDRDALLFGIEQSLQVVMLRPSEDVVMRLPFSGGVREVTWGDLRNALLRLKVVMPQLEYDPTILADEFEWIKLQPGFGFTGYYEPTLEADGKPSAMYPYPIYGPPADLAEKGPLYDRHSVDRQHMLAGRGLEIAWARDDLDVFFLHIQGSGRLNYPDGTTRHVLFAGKNGRPYVSLGSILKERRLLDQKDINMDSIRQYMRENSDRKTELLDLNTSYVFFKLADDGPLGGMGRPLTPMLSMAVDPTVLPYGSLVFFNVNLPNEFGVHNTPVYSLGLPQDTGGAIKGRRIDLFSGAGERARMLAGHLNQEGTVYLLLLKKTEPTPAEAPAAPLAQDTATR